MIQFYSSQEPLISQIRTLKSTQNKDTKSTDGLPHQRFNLQVLVDEQRRRLKAK